MAVTQRFNDATLQTAKFLYLLRDSIGGSRREKRRPRNILGEEETDLTNID